MIEHFLDKLGIVFYTNMVQYPNVLSIQTLQYELKVEVESRLSAVRCRLSEFKLVKEHPMLLDLTRQQIDGISNYMWAKNQNDKWPECVEFNRKLDATRDQSFTDVTPEFKPYV